MSATTSAWNGFEALDPGHVLLLEASAGTGKTFQIAQLVLRLVAEVGVPIDKILTITFTNAATAELRDRVRRRLESARLALAGDDIAGDDDLVTRLRLDRVRAHDRIVASLGVFDLAPISTIHGFSQRMLDVFAFESGQESGLTLLPSAQDIWSELVDDELARVYATASEADLSVLEGVGFGRERLMAISKAMCGAVEPSVSLDTSDITAAELLAEWRTIVDGFSAWWRSEEGRAALDALRAEGERPAPSTKAPVRRRYSGQVIKAAPIGDAIDGWLRRGAGELPSTLGGAKNVRLATLDRWVGSTPVESFEAYPLFARFEQLCADLDALVPQLNAAVIGRFARTIRARVAAGLERRGLLTYDAMLSRLAERIVAQGPQGSLAAAIRSRFDVALVDEFQDTDSAQWTVLKAVFGDPVHARRLLLIGDPKQAIYKFRGADIFVYLEAAATATARYTMGTNWRSDGAYVEAMNRLWREGSGAFELDVDGQTIDYVEVAASPASKRSRISGLPAVAIASGADGEAASRARRPFEIRWFDRMTLDGPGAPGRRIGGKDDGIALAATLAADEIVRLLSGPVTVGPEGEQEPLQPGHIAVLVRTHPQGRAVKLALARRRVPAVTAATGKVFESPAVGWLAAWLDAVAEAGRDTPARVLVTTPLFGWTAQALATALTDQTPDGATSPAAVRWAEFTAAIGRWAGMWARFGFVRVFEGALDEWGVLPRLLACPSGERLATDLRHLCECLHAEERRTRLGPGGLASWLRAQKATAADGDDTLALRLESDARAVQIVTTHASKGLEYRIVLVPFAWAGREVTDDGKPFLHHPVDADRAALELRPKGDPDRVTALGGLEAEERQEDMRLLYVALTRARHHAVVWFGLAGRASGNTGGTALGRLLLRGDGDTDQGSGCPVFPAGKDPGAEDAVVQTCADVLDALANGSGETIGWSTELTPPDECVLWSAPLAPEAQLAAQPWPHDRSLRSAWQLASFTQMSRRAAHADDEPHREADAQVEAATQALGVASLAAVSVLTADEEPVLERDARLEAPLPLDALRGGTDTGTWIHSVFEHLDFQADTGDSVALTALVAAQRTQAGLPTDAIQTGAVVAALPAILATPLGKREGADPLGLPSALRLADLARRDRLDELRFDLRLAAGARWRANESRTLSFSAIASALQQRSEPGWDGAAWRDAFCAQTPPPIDAIAGILTGSIDLVARVDGRYVIADYKTNRIAPTEDRRESLRRHYGPDWLSWEMGRHAYYLQGLLYTIALHRFLGQRLVGYDYDTHVGGLLYLFVRGMEGPDTVRTDGRCHGVYADRWPKAVVEAFDLALLVDREVR